MSRKIVLVLMILSVFGLQSAFAQYHLPEPVFYEGRAAAEAPLLSAQADGLPSETAYLWDYVPENTSEPMLFVPLFALAAAASTDADEAEVASSIRNNRFYLESIRLAKLAQSAYDDGDYDKSNEYATEAVRYAQMSDEFVELQLKIKETNDTIAAAKQRLDWASSTGADKKNPDEYAEAEGFYTVSLDSRKAEQWDAAIEAANKVINILAYAEAPPSGVLPAQYTVRTWASNKDCLWNIAGRSWAYGDPFKWRLIYDANKDKLPDAGNPDLINPGMVLDIPSASGETRQGMWQADSSY